MPRILRTSAFRQALFFALLFGLSTALLLALLYYASVGVMARQTDETIDAEITGLAEHFQSGGLAELGRVVEERAANQRDSLYLFVDTRWRRLSGNLSDWPEAEARPDGWLDFTYRRQVGETRVERHARGRGLRLGGGLHLLVGRDIEDRWQIERLLAASLSWAGAITLLLGLAGGLLASRTLLRRVEAVNRACREIMAGDLGRRLPEGKGDTEIDRLARQVNLMVARIESLMTGLRHVSDGIAHDLRSPLTRMRARLEGALNGGATPEDYREAIEKALSDSEELLSLFDALHNIARTESGDLRQRMAPVDLAATASDVAELYAPSAEKAGLSLAVEGEGPLMVHGHAQLLAQALANLVDNAVKYARPGDEISLHVGRGAEGAELSVIDTGPGIDAADRDRAVRRFERLDADGSVAGRGLGLSLVSAVAALHGGTLVLTDNEPGLRASLRMPLGVGSR